MASLRRKVPIVADELREWSQPAGTIVAPHGLKGAVKVRPQSDVMAGLFTVGNAFCLVFPSGRRQKVTVQSCFAKGAHFVVKFAEMDHIDKAERCVGLSLTVHKDWRPTLEEDEFLLSDIVGMTVVTAAGEVVGEVLEVMESPAHDLLVTERGLIPMTKDIVKEIDTVGRRIVIDALPQGLLEEVSPKRQSRRQK